MPKMTVGELIEELTKFPADREVRVNIDDCGGHITGVDGIDPAVVWIEAT